jgi:hypothetical protein
VKSWKTLALVVVLLGVTTATVVPLARRGARSARALVEATPRPSTHCYPEQSAALFVGVRQFASASLEPIPYAVDDAVDLAYLVAFDRRIRLVVPSRIVLSLSGDAVKPESQARLGALLHAGAVRRDAQPARIRALLEKQAALVGNDGLFIVSIASHGFLRDGVPFILGASSLIDAPETTLSTARLFDVISSHAVQRSLILVDACRERLTPQRRSVRAAMTAAPLIDRIGRRRGQVVLYAAAAGQYAYDDDTARNGVFTKAVMDGLKCDAAKVGGYVTASTLAGYVERSVRTWIRENRDPNVVSATQSEIDGGALNMPLAQCWTPPRLGPSEATSDGTMVRAEFDDGTPPWSRDAGGVVVGTRVADLDADGAREVVFATREKVGAFDADGNAIWSAGDGGRLTAYDVGRLFREQHTSQVVAAWTGEHSSRLAAYAPDGLRLAEFTSDGPFEHVVIARASTRHAPKIVATSGNTLLVFDPKKFASGKPLWSGVITPRTQRIRSLALIDYDRDGKVDIAVTTSGGARVVVDLKGHAISGGAAHFERNSRRGRRSRQ